MAVQQDRRLRLFARVLPARDGGVKLNLWPIAQGGSATTQTLPSLGAVNAEGEKIAERDFSTHEIKIGGLRIVHKQRLSKNLVFLGLRAPGGMLIETISWSKEQRCSHQWHCYLPSSPGNTTQTTADRAA